MNAETTTRSEWVTRAMFALGLGACAVYLGWRVLGLDDGAPLWLSVPSLVVESIGIAGSAVLVWALWPTPRQRDVVGDRPPVGAVDVVVRGDIHALHELRTTLVALRSVTAVARVTVLDPSGRLAVAAVAAEFGAGYSVAEGCEFAALRSAVHTGFVLVLDAGDVPVPDIVERLAAAVDGGDVAVVQGMGVSLVGDAPERGVDLRHELLFERCGLNPALGARGHALWLGSGSLVRTDTLAVASGAHGEGGVDFTSAGARLVAAGHRVVCSVGAPVVAHRIALDRAQARTEQAAHDHELLRRLLGAGGSTRSSQDRLVSWLASASWAVRAVSPYGVVAVVALLAAALLSGRAPFDVAAPMALLVGLPGVVLLSLGLGRASGWTLRPGDRTRRALMAGGRVSSGPVLTVAVLGLVLVARAVSDRWLHIAPVIDRSQLIVLVLGAAWLLGISLDVLRDEARLGRVPRAPRATSSLSAVLGDRAVSVVDLTGRGAGVRAPLPLQVGEQLCFEAALPTRSGVTSVAVDAVVRNARPVGPDWRIGIEFGPLDPVVANALAEYCVIETSRLHLGVPLHLDGVAAHGAGALHWVADATVAVRGGGATAPVAQPSKP